ncbi:DNA-deoxyinosine glycosylase [Andreprevotia chitinilytica]|uniref:DNA-deoxyinosine glycosylase n=1 Tax=Andreprevotia chitinilytica TaxID=396808 RepID=UPI000556B6E9|nr:DNA-deoxyinosine glycosylase [Andreprevotia chitinilytica]
MQTALNCLPPVVNPDVRVLVLGSLPGAASLAQQAYYAHPRNAFWPIMAALTQQPLAALPYMERLQALLDAGVGLWDVVGQAKRRGSLDADLRDVSTNPLFELITTLPRLQAIAFNGQTAYKLGHKQLPPHLPYYALPSTSPALTTAFAAKLQAWSVLHPHLHG